LETLLEFLRFPSISTQSEHVPDMLACADWLVGLFRSYGLTAEVRPTKGHPVVIAHAAPRDPAKRTVLIYGHYDVQPPDPLGEWNSPPFDPVIKNDRVWARGASDNKGQILSHILGVGEALKRDGELPVNVIFLVEGEEEIGSPNLPDFLRENRGELACDVIAISDTGMVKEGQPTLSFSLRGIAALEMHLRGPAFDLHSGIYGGAVANPATAVARLIAGLHDENGHVVIDGFYDEVRPMFDWEREALAALPVSDQDLIEETGAPELFGEKGFSSIERIGARPTAEVNGIGGGYQGEGTKTVLPKEAFAKLTFRLVPNQAPDEILDRVERHLRAHCPPGIVLDLVRGHSGEPYFTDPNTPYGRAARAALAETFGKAPSLTRDGGTIPILLSFREILGADSLLLALASPDCRAHSPNESFPLANFAAGIRLNQSLLRHLAAISGD